MTDTQWPLYEVFIQEKPGKPHQNVGSVHAVDREMALLNARTVFGRRPLCHSLWAAPHTAILTRTQEELAKNPLRPTVKTEAPTATYAVFRKTTQRRVMAFVVYAGEITAVSPEHALQQAIETYSDATVYVWWIIPTAAMVKTDEDDVDSFFAPALDKTYRQPSAYHTFSAMRRAKRLRKKKE